MAQTLLDSGVLTVWRGNNSSPPGSMPSLNYTQLYQGYYGEKAVGITRWYTAQQHSDRPDIVVQIQRTYGIKVGSDIATISPFTHEETGAYKIVQIQQVWNAENLPMTDLTLERDDGIDTSLLTTESNA